MLFSTSTVTPTRTRSGRLRRHLITLSLAAIAGGAIVGASAGPAFAAEVPIDMQLACDNQYGPSSTAWINPELTSVPPVFRWECRSRSSRGPIDVDRACREQLLNANARPGHRNPQDPNSWYCYIP